MKLNKTKLDNVRNLVNSVTQLDDSIQVHLYDIDPKITERLHYDLIDIEETIKELIVELEVDNTVV